MRTRLFLLLLLLLLVAALAACSPPPPPAEAVAAAVQGTLAARTATVQVYASTVTAAAFTPTPTHTPTATLEPTATATLTPPPPPSRTPSPTPDTRVIIEEPMKFLCEGWDVRGTFRGVYPQPNSGIVKETNADAGYSFIEETGRMDGFTVAYYNPASPNNNFADWYTCSIERFVTGEGAHIALNDYFYKPEYADNWDRSRLDPRLGEEGFVLLAKEHKAAGSGKAEQHVRFRYRNFIVDIGADGWDHEMDLDYLIDVAKLVVSRLETAYLSEIAAP
jgi:hypothetical protein